MRSKVGVLADWIVPVMSSLCWTTSFIQPLLQFHTGKVTAAGPLTLCLALWLDWVNRLSVWYEVVRDLECPWKWFTGTRTCNRQPLFLGLGSRIRPTGSQPDIETRSRWPEAEPVRLSLDQPNTTEPAAVSVSRIPVDHWVLGWPVMWHYGGNCQLSQKLYLLWRSVFISTGGL